MSVLGLDLGTSGVRAVTYALDGGVRGAASAPLTLLRDGAGCVELEAQELIDAAESVVRTAAGKADAAGDPVEAVGFSVLGEAVVPIGPDRRPLARVAVSMDERGHGAAESFGHVFGRPRFTEITGQPLNGMFSLFKIMAGEEAWQRAWGYRCMGDLLTERWTGRAVIDVSQAARSGMLDVGLGKWSPEILAAAASSAPWIVPERLPAVAAGGTAIGEVLPECADDLGLPQGTLMVAGAHDQAAAFLGAGGAPGERTVIAFGSSDCLTIGSGHRPRGLEGTGFASYRVDDSLWVTLAGTAAGGWALEWYASIVEREVADLFDRLPADPPALLMLPYLAGSGTLDNDPDARGCIHGLTLDTDTTEIARAIVESAGFEFAKVIDAVESRGVRVGDLRVTGAGAENPSALAARAEATGRPLTPVARDASARGAAMLAVTALGGDPAALVGPPIAEPASPDPSRGEWYAAQRQAYAALHPATAGILAHLSRRRTTTQKENIA